jgi:ATP-binding cassette subfamily C protein LapB
MSAEGLTQLGNASIGNVGVVDSLLDSLLLICRIQGVATSRDALTSGLPLRDGKMTPALLKRSAERVNLAVTVLKKPLEKIRSEFLPAILLLKDEEACVVTKLDFSANQAHVIFPELKYQSLSMN